MSRQCFYYCNRQELKVKPNIFSFPYSDHYGILVNIPLERTLPQHNNTKLVPRPNSVSGFKSVLPKTAIGDLVVKLNTYEWDLLLSRHTSYSAQQNINVIFDIFINNLNFFSLLKRINDKHEWELRDMKDRLIFLHSIMKNRKSAVSSL